MVGGWFLAVVVAMEGGLVVDVASREVVAMIVLPLPVGRCRLCCYYCVDA